MKSIKFYYKAICIFIYAHYLAHKYHQPVSKIYYAYIHLYCDFKPVVSLLNKVKTEKLNFDDAIIDLLKAKEMIERLFDEGDLHSWNSKNGYD